MLVKISHLEPNTETEKLSTYLRCFHNLADINIYFSKNFSYHYLKTNLNSLNYIQLLTKTVKRGKGLFLDLVYDTYDMILMFMIYDAKLGFYQM